VRLVCGDVRGGSHGRHDVVLALNFSYWVFKTRHELRDYFAGVREALAPDGVFYLDAYGGWESHEPMREPRPVRRTGVTYVWEQAGFDAISHDVVNHIHFEFPDGTRLRKAFTYEWRLWTLPELRETLAEAGFPDAAVHWDVSADEQRAVYRPRRRAANEPAWLAYIVAGKPRQARGAGARGAAAAAMAGPVRRPRARGRGARG
jgi:SAM-dependent methyltransferase